MNPTARILICAALAAAIAAMAAPELAVHLHGLGPVIALACAAALNRIDSVTGGTAKAKTEDDQPQP
jgi:hypothetical protein